MPYQLKRVRTVLIKVESTEGVDAVPAGIDAVRLIEAPRIGFGAEIINDRPELDNQLLDEEGPIEPSAKWVELTLKGQVRGLGSAYNGTTAVPELHAVAQGVGLAAVFSATPTPNWTYDTATTGLKSLTAKVWTGTDTGVYVLRTLLGARVSRLAFNFRAGKPVEWEATLRGLYVGPSDTALIAAAYPSTTTPPRFQAAASWALGALSGAAVSEASVLYDNKLKARLSANVADNIAGFAVTGRRLGHSAKFEFARIADYDAFTKWTTSPREVLNIDVPGGAGVQYNRFKFDADKAVILDAPTEEDDDGITLYGVSGKLTPEGTNRAKITFD